ncbi:MAG: acetyl-CoA C-acyltransferase, partial [Ruminiclostridium sp.]|nr:acetyl-CoA C-acyltransferase [Ruminiclostridium sp.]
MREVYVVSSCRTAVGSFGGSLKDTPAAELGAIVMAEALKRGNVKGEWLDEVMFGNVLSAAQGQNVARQCAVKAGIPLSVPAY